MKKVDGFSFSFDDKCCSSCKGKCCIGESGYIWINEEEIKNIATSLNINTDLFISNYTRKLGDRYSLTESKIGYNNYACVFFDTKKHHCNIYKYRPSQCKSYPFWDYVKNNREAQQECIGIKLD